MNDNTQFEKDEIVVFRAIYCYKAEDTSDIPASSGLVTWQGRMVFTVNYQLGSRHVISHNHTFRLSLQL
jgi:hypothetical protein